MTIKEPIEWSKGFQEGFIEGKEKALKKARDEIRKLIVKHYGKDEVVNAMYELEEALGFKD